MMEKAEKIAIAIAIVYLKFKQSRQLYYHIMNSANGVLLQFKGGTPKPYTKLGRLSAEPT